MSPDLAMISDGKKFMWDGQLYDNREEAARAAESYKNENFEIQMVDEDGKFLVYTRRTVKEWVATTQ
jgi:predicted O-methyltransferase YrrM